MMFRPTLILSLAVSRIVAMYPASFIHGPAQTSSAPARYGTPITSIGGLTEAYVYAVNRDRWRENSKTALSSRSTFDPRARRFTGLPYGKPTQPVRIVEPKKRKTLGSFYWYCAALGWRRTKGDNLKCADVLRTVFSSIETH